MANSYFIRYETMYITLWISISDIVPCGQCKYDIRYLILLFDDIFLYLNVLWFHIKFYWKIQRKKYEKTNMTKLDLWFKNDCFQTFVKIPFFKFWKRECKVNLKLIIYYEILRSYLFLLSNVYIEKLEKVKFEHLQKLKRFLLI